MELINPFLSNYPGLTKEKVKYSEMLYWLHNYVQKAYHLDGKPYKISSVAMYAEWRSQDTESWIFRLEGIPPKNKIIIKESKYDVWFKLFWL